MDQPPQGFGAPPFGPPPAPPAPSAPPRDNTLSFVLAFGLSAASFLCCGAFFVIPLAFAIAAAVQASQGNHEGARKMARVAAIVAGLMMALAALALVGYVAMVLLYASLHGATYAN